MALDPGYGRALPPLSASQRRTIVSTIAGIELHAVAPPGGALGGDHSRTAAEKGVEHDVAGRRAIEDRVGDHRHGLDGGVQRQQIALLAAAGKSSRPAAPL